MDNIVLLILISNKDATDVYPYISVLPYTQLAGLYPKLRTRLSLSGKNPGFSANTFFMSLIYAQFQKLKLASRNRFGVGFWFA